MKLLDIAAELSRETGVPVSSITGRGGGASQPRRAAIWAARELLGYSFNRIGMLFDGRDHTTIICAYRCALNLRKTDAEFYELTEYVRGLMLLGKAA